MIGSLIVQSDTEHVNPGPHWWRTPQVVPKVWWCCCCCALHITHDCPCNRSAYRLCWNMTRFYEHNDMATSNPFDDLQCGAFSGGDDIFDGDDEDDVFLGSVISKEEMQLIKRRGLGRQRRNTLDAMMIAEGAENHPSLDPSLVAAVDFTSRQHCSDSMLNDDSPLLAVGPHQLGQTGSCLGLTVTRSGRLVKPPPSLTISQPSVIELNKATLTNTRRNSGYHLVQIQYEDVFESGSRPPSPSSRVRKLGNSLPPVSSGKDSFSGLSSLSEDAKEENGRGKKCIKWSKDLVQRTDYDETSPLSRILTADSRKPLKPCLKRRAFAPSEGIASLASPKPKHVVRVKRVYYEDDEQLQYLLASVPGILDQMLKQSSGNASTSTKRKGSASLWQVFEEEEEGGGEGAEKEERRARDQAKEVSPYKGSSIKALRHAKHGPLRGMNGSSLLATMGPPQRNTR